jgi:hypothetical protein
MSQRDKRELRLLKALANARFWAVEIAATVVFFVWLYHHFMHELYVH